MRRGPKFSLVALHERLHYAPNTGQFTWLKNSGRAKAGDLAGSTRTDGYVQIKICGKMCLAHRLAWFYVQGAWPEKQIDHRNLNRADNSWENLRGATNSQNGANSALRKNNTSGHRGVHWYGQTKKWQAQIMHLGVRLHLGFFGTKVKAIEAYEEKAKELKGDFYR